MSGFLKTVWKNSIRALSRRYKNYKQTQCFFPSSTRLSSSHCPPFSTFCPFTGPKQGFKVQWNQGLGSSSLTPFSKVQTYIYTSTGIHIRSHLVVRDDQNIVRTTKITLTLVLWTSKIRVCNLHISTCLLLIPHPTGTFRKQRQICSFLSRSNHNFGHHGW